MNVNEFINLWVYKENPKGKNGDKMVCMKEEDKAAMLASGLSPAEYVARMIGPRFVTRAGRGGAVVVRLADGNEWLAGYDYARIETAK